MNHFRWNEPPRPPRHDGVENDIEKPSLTMTPPRIHEFSYSSSYGNDVHNECDALLKSKTLLQDEINDSRTSKVFAFYLFICLSTALRNFEPGIVSSMMPHIRSDLGLDYSQQGTITASPDFGIAPGAVLSIWIFRRFRKQEYHVLVVILLVAAAVAMACAWYPTYGTLITARALGGACWAQAAVHFPVWIDQRGPASCKTMWLACTNVSILVGVVLGYMVGGLSNTRTPIVRSATWVPLYFVAGACMAVCGIMAVVWFDPEVVHADETEPNATTTAIDTNEEPSTPSAIVGEEERSYQNSQTIIAQHDSNHNYHTENTSVGEVLGHLANSVPFCLAVGMTGCISGGIVYCLYFAAQVAEARGMSATTTFGLVLAVFLTAPAPGMYLGSWIVHHVGGFHGYRDHVATFGMALASAVVVLLAALAMPWSWHVFGDSNPPLATISFVAAFWVFAFAGAMAGPPLNGVAVSAVPHATHVASAVQFAVANAAKIVVPQWGGILCNRMGLLPGFHTTLVVTSMVFVLFSGMGLLHAQRQWQCQRR